MGAEIDETYANSERFERPFGKLLQLLRACVLNGRNCATTFCNSLSPGAFMPSCLRPSWIFDFSGGG